MPARKSADPVPLSPDWREAVPEDRLAHLIKDATRSLTRGLQIRLIDHSVSHGHWPFLRILWERDGLTQRQLAELAGLSEPTAYSALGVMERMGYITRRKLPDNARNIPVFLTKEGKALKRKLIPLAENLHKTAVRGLSIDELRTFKKCLHTIIDNLTEDERECNRSVPPLRKMV